MPLTEVFDFLDRNGILNLLLFYWYKSCNTYGRKTQI